MTLCTGAAAGGPEAVGPAAAPGSPRGGTAVPLDIEEGELVRESNEPIGQGAVGTTYRATFNGRPVCIKVRLRGTSLEHGCQRLESGVAAGGGGGGGPTGGGFWTLREVVF